MKYIKQYTLQYVNNSGETVARDYFFSYDEAMKFIENYNNDNDWGLILEDDTGRQVWSNC